MTDNVGSSSTYNPERAIPELGDSVPCPTPEEQAATLSDFALFYDAVDVAQKIDNTGGDSAVSITLWSWAEHIAAIRPNPEP